MPIKDISKEEQSHLFLPGGVKREHLQLTEGDRANFHTKLPLKYYNNLADMMYEKDCGSAVADSSFVNSDIVNPNSFTRSSAWPITVRSVVTEDVKNEVMEVLMTAMEKFHWDNTEIANFLKRELDTRFGCSWHVVTGEEYGFDIDFEAEAMMYIFYGSLAILLWKCGTQLLKEVRYKTAKEEEEKLRKEKLTKSGSKYSKVFY